MSVPLLSIVIANYNYGRFLSEAIESVISQDCYDQVELIVCDANSKDNSMEIIKKYNKYISWWCSEPDSGQSAAFNKGFSRSHGKFLTWLNADDILLPGVVNKLNKASRIHPGCEWFVGGSFWLDVRMHIINCAKGRPFSEMRYREGIVNTWGPSSFFTKRLLDSVGGVDERFHMMMDMDLWLRFAYVSKARYLPFIDYAWGQRLHPESKMSGHNFNVKGEFDSCHTEAEKIIRNRHYPQLLKEKQYIRDYFHARKGSWITHILSMHLNKAIESRLDLLRYHGKHYKEFYK